MTTNPTTATDEGDCAVPATYLRGSSNNDYWVYVAKDDKNQILYIGTTGVGFARLSQHRRSSAWASKVERIDVEHFTTKADALEVESALIKMHKPPYNVMGCRLVERRQRELPPSPSIDERLYEWVADLVTEVDIARWLSWSVKRVREEIDAGTLPGSVTCDNRCYITSRDFLEAWALRSSNVQEDREWAEAYLGGLG